MIIEAAGGIRDGWISVQSVGAAAAIVEHAVRSTIHLFESELGISDHQRACNRILELVARHGGSVPRHKIATSKILDTQREYADALELLQHQGKITITPVDTNRKNDLIQGDTDTAKG